MISRRKKEAIILIIVGLGLMAFSTIISSCEKKPIQTVFEKLERILP